MADYIAVHRIIVGGAGKARTVINPGERFDPATIGMDDKELQSLLSQTPPGARVPTDLEAAPPPPPPTEAGPTGGQQSPPESDNITRDPPPNEPA